MQKGAKKVMGAPVDLTRKNISHQDAIEPSYFISVPILNIAIKHGLLDKEGLILSKKGGYNNGSSWKKPLYVLIDRDDDGLINISKTIDMKSILSTLKSEGVTLQGHLSNEEIILGRGYLVEKDRLLELYNKYVSDEFGQLFPYAVGSLAIKREKEGFKFVPYSNSNNKNDELKGHSEWHMPDLTGLPLRVALEKVANYTDRIKIYGVGTVKDQSPKPHESVSKDTVCIIYGSIDGR